MENLTFFVSVLVLALLAAALELAFQFFMHPNMFLYPYGVWVAKLARKNELLRHLTRVLGRCRYCNGTWVGIYTYKYFFGIDLPILLMIGATALFVNLLTTHVWKEVDPVGIIDAKLNHVYHHDTPVKPMLQTYVILGAVYSFIYLAMPLMF